MAESDSLLLRQRRGGQLRAGSQLLRDRRRIPHGHRDRRLVAGALFQNTTYALVCSGAGGTDAIAVTALVDPAAAPQIDFTAADPDVGCTLAAKNSSRYSADLASALSVAAEV